MKYNLDSFRGLEFLFYEPLSEQFDETSEPEYVRIFFEEVPICEI